MRSVLRIVIVAAAVASAPLDAAAATLTSTLVSPADGAQAADLSQPIRWTAVANADAYYLYVGSSIGAKDLVDSGATQQTSYVARNLPINQVVYARIWTKIAGIWRYADASFKGTPLSTSIVYPSNGATNVDLGLPVRWNAVPNAQAYYLYVGSAPGANDYVNTGAIQETSYLVRTVPFYRTVYARVWVKVNDVWRYTDSSFSGAILVSYLSYPQNGVTNADLGLPIRWTAVPDVQSYYLYVGTSPGAKDLVDTGAITQTSYVAAGLPSGRTLYVRLWTKVAGIWRYTDATFSAGVFVATFITPAPGASSVDPSQAWTWTAVPNAQAYYLYVGSVPGANDLVDSHEIQQTSFVVTRPLPPNRTLYARIWTKAGGVWRYSEMSFRAALIVARLIYPPAGGTLIDQTRPAAWAAVPDAQAYYLYVGSTPGARDLVDSSATPLTAHPISGLPPGRTVYARLWTLLAGVWFYSDSTFSAGLVAPEFIYPYNGATSVDPTQPFQWAPPSGAEMHYLTIGTTPGSHDVLDSGEISGTSLTPGTLPQRRLYARVWSKVNGGWTTHSDITFTSRDRSRSAAIVYPAATTTAFDTGTPFRWSSAALNQGYRLRIGTAAGASDLHDSGIINVTRRFVPNLPLNVALYGRIETNIDGQWLPADFTFTVAANSFSEAAQIDAALWATHFVRSMAPSDNRPFGWTPLLAAVAPRYDALCSDFAAVLRQMLHEVNIALPARRLDLSFNGTSRSAHTLVELQQVQTQRWMLLDPTFDVTVMRGDGTWATAEDMSQSTGSFDWNAVSYYFLGSAADYYLRNYYLDYPLLYANVIHQGQSFVPDSTWASPLAYLSEALMPTAQPRTYVIRCWAGNVTSAIIDGKLTTVACNGIASTSSAFVASAVTAPNPGTPGFSLYEVPRFRF